MTATDLLTALRAAGVMVIREGDRLRCEPASAIPGELRASIRDHKPTLLALLNTPDGIAWRAAAIRAQLPERGPVPLLVAVRDVAPTPGRCVSCVAPLDADAAFGRCASCVAAVRYTLGLDVSTPPSGDVATAPQRPSTTSRLPPVPGRGDFRRGP